MSRSSAFVARIWLIGVLPFTCFSATRINPLRIPLVFTANIGQAPTDAQFVGRMQGAGILLHGDGFTLLRGGASERRLRMRLGGAQAPAVVTQACQGLSRYYWGDERSHDASDCRRVEYRHVYEGVTLAYYGNAGALEYDFIVEAGADPAAISFYFEGSRSLSVNQHGELLIATPFGEIRQARPLIYQTIHGRKRAVRGKYVVHGSGAGFEIGPYDRRATLIIDPVLASAAYLGGASFDQANGVAVDAGGGIYVVGETWSFDVTPGAYGQSSARSNSDVFVAKLNSTGTAVLFTVFLAGNSRDVGTAITLDAHGDICIVGYTYSSNFPTTSGALRRTPAGQEDGFIAKLSGSTGALIYATYLGGQGSDFATAVAVDAAGYIYAAGNTNSVDFPISSRALQPAFRGGFSDCFVAKIDPVRSTLVYSTYLGGTATDTTAAIAVANDGAVYITGSTSSTDLPVQNSGRSYSGNGDAFVAELDSSGSRLLFSTYLGGSGADNANTVALDGNDILVAGNTSSSDLPAVTNSFQPALRGSYDGFVARISGGAISTCAYLGGIASDSVSAMALDAGGNVYLAGYTFSADFPTSGELQSFGGRQDAFVAILDKNLARLIWASFLGGAGDDAAAALTIDAQGVLSVVGITTSADFLARSGVGRRAQTRSDADAFLVKISGTSASLPPTPISLTPSSGSGYTQTFTFQFSHPGGAGMIAAAALRLSGADGQDCTMYYTFPSSTVQMFNDNDTAWIGPALIGSANGLQNSRCVLNTAGVSFSMSGTALTLTVPLAFRPAFQGVRTVSVQLTGTNGLYTGLQQMGTWTVPINVAPSADSLVPLSGSGMSRTFAFQFSHPAGAAMIGGAAIRIAGLDGQDCTLYYIFSGPTVLMMNDTDTAWIGPFRLGTANPLQNSRCIVDTAGTSVSSSGNQLTLSIPIQFQQQFSGSRSVSVQLTGTDGLYTPFLQVGAWTVPLTKVPPSPLTLTPASGGGSSQSFSFQFSHPNGAAMIAAAAVRVAGTDGQECTLYYALSASLVYLFNDAGTAWMGPVSIGSGSTLQNSRCVVNMAASSILTSGTTLTLNTAVTFTAAFAGNRTVSVQLTGADGLYTGFQQVGTWTVPGSAAPSPVSLSPSSGSGRTQIFTWQFSHPGGTTMIAAAALRIQGADGQDCTMYYVFSAGTAWMMNDSSTQWMGPERIGSVSTLQNSRCAVNVGGISVASSGTTLSLTVPMTFLPQFGGNRTLSVQLTGTNGLYTSFQQMGTWTVL